MSNIEWFRKRLLDYFSIQTQCYQNIFRDKTLLNTWLGHVASNHEQSLAQRAFQTLSNEGLIFDANGDKWFTITDEGRIYLKGEQVISEKESFAEFAKIYSLHPRILKVSGELFSNSHYKEAIQSALVEVIERVKEVTGHPKDSKGRELDGDDLMNRAFGCDGDEQIPLVRLNYLNNSLEKVEQRGFMCLFKGIVGIRNKKAHLNFVQDDVNKAFEYLALASLLMRLLDDDFLKHFRS